MGKERAASAIWSELTQFSLYKRTQGRVARQVTFAAGAIIFALAAWQFFSFMGGMNTLSASGSTKILALGVPVLLLAGGLWTCFRMVNLPRFADFLIAVEAEMTKVSWPGRGELVRATLVVIGVVFVLALSLFTYDIILRYAFQAIGVLQKPG